MHRSLTATMIAAAVGLQGPFLAYLGRLPPVGVTSLSAITLSLATLLFYGERAGVLAGAFRSHTFTAAFGSVGMLVGWYADAGFTPMIGYGACLCGCSDSLAGLGLVTGFRWMQPCMCIACAVGLALSGTCMVWRPRAVGRLIFSSASMLVCMSMAGWFAGALQLASAQSALLADYASMVLGMAFGPALLEAVLCNVWRRISIAGASTPSRSETWGKDK